MLFDFMHLFSETNGWVSMDEMIVQALQSFPHQLDGRMTPKSGNNDNANVEHF
jgi:hypothetical protein